METRPPRDGLVRALYPGVELRSDEGAAMPTMHGHFAVFNDWAHIRSVYEGDFIERIAPGAFARTFTNNRTKMRVTFQHGKDPQLGDKVLGPIQELREDATGAYYEVPLLDTSYNRDLLPGLEAGLYGASFRFRVLKEQYDQKPKTSTHNPDSLPERTITEAEVMEFGPVTYPAYDGASAGIRSMTDEDIISRFLSDPQRVRELLGQDALPDAGPAVEPHSDEGTRVALPHRFATREEYLEWISSI